MLRYADDRDSLLRMTASNHSTIPLLLLHFQSLYSDQEGP